jgi:hypothetical protein
LKKGDLEMKGLKIKRLVIGISTAIASLVWFSSCSGGGGFDSGSVSATPITVTTVSGVVSDGPIHNARVFIDTDSDGIFSGVEPNTLTDINGSYTLSYINRGKDYFLIAEGSVDLNTTDLLDNNESNMSFVMYTMLEANNTATKDINPLVFRDYLKELNVTDDNISAFISSDTNLTTQQLFQGFLDNKKDEMGDVLQKLSIPLKELNLKTISTFECNDALETNVDVGMKKIAGVYYPSFAGYTLPGIWVQRDYDSDGIAKANELGIDFKYDFNSYGKVLMNISIIDTWIPLGNYCIDNTQTKLTFNEGDASSVVYFEFIEHRDTNCIKTAKYKILDGNTTFDDYYELCKIQ